MTGSDACGQSALNTATCSSAPTHLFVCADRMGEQQRYAVRARIRAYVAVKAAPEHARASWAHVLAALLAGLDRDDLVGRALHVRLAHALGEACGNVGQRDVGRRARVRGRYEMGRERI